MPAKSRREPLPCASAGSTTGGASGFDRKTVNRIENGRHSPSLDRVFILAHALDVQPLELFQQRGP
ncbi:helix-turn-helix transcriptional regulator [Saccharothrix yanglingensis]|uniref:helix-turn-helix transcriptional regulator n=1 Tax=Saccharothrix yanglingensis TaxID=659496 RepID=UPI0035282F66